VVTELLLDHLLRQGSHRNVEIQVMTLRQPDHSGFEGPMYLAETPDHQWMGYVEVHDVSVLVNGSKAASLHAPALWETAVTGSEPSGHHELAGAEARSATSISEYAWARSTYSGGGGDNCVEAALRPEADLIRDSKDTRRGHAAVRPAAWSAFTAHAAESPV
jgi:hypothetical protein